MQTISMEKVKKDLLSSDFYLNCNIPLGYTAGFPILKIMNGCLCVTIPYLRYQTTGEVDKTLVYPLRYGITLELPTLQVVAFENYEYEAVFQTPRYRKYKIFLKGNSYGKQITDISLDVVFFINMC